MKGIGIMRSWDYLPEYMRIPEIKPYYDYLKKKRVSLLLKRIFDVTASLGLLLVLFLPMLVIALWIKLDSKGPVLFRQERVTTYGKHFRIHKFRTMIDHADEKGSGVTANMDSRITRAGAKLRHLRLDELPQLIDVFAGNMSFVGTRPESVKYVREYQPEYFATLLLPAGVTSETSIIYKDEDELLTGAENVEDTYINIILPEKMRLNLKSVRSFSIRNDIHTMFRTVTAVFGRNNS